MNEKENILEVTSCCGYELMYKKVGENDYELWEFCGMCLGFDWEVTRNTLND